VSSPKVIIVSGATSGIGLACARSLVAAGHRVHGFGRSAQKVAAAKEATGAAITALDIRDEEACRALVDGVLENEGRIDGLINAAGFLEMERSHKISSESLDTQLDVLFKAPFRLTQLVLPAMRKQGAGLVLNIGSVSGRRPAPGHAIYGAAKAALEHLTRSLAAEYAPKGVRFLCLSPGPVETNLLDDLSLKMLARKVPLGRLGRPEEVAALAAFLFSGQADFMTGTSLAIDGGAAL
jgi:3-oxoacyl-[acyl-carrier protein] reductase